MAELAGILPFLLIAVLFWLLFIRPQTRRQREAQAMQAGVGVGDDVVLTSGIFGTITGAADDHVLVEVATGVVIKVDRRALALVQRDPEAEHLDSTDSVGDEGVALDKTDDSAGETPDEQER